MTSTGRARGPAKLTEKGHATRARILECTAALIYANGVHATNNEQVRRAAEVSGSQLNHYFATKEDLILGVIEWQAERILAFHRSSQFGGFTSVDAFRQWAKHYASYERAYREGCTLGSLASEILKSDLDVHADLANAFAQWHDIFRGGIETMRGRGLLRQQADPVQLANMLLAAFQGGMLLAQVSGDIIPLRDALGSAIDHLESFALDSSVDA